MDVFPMTTEDIRAARINWHPHVHQHFDEELYFVLFRSSRANNVSQLLDVLLAEAGISYYCSYVVFGYFDSLVRVWLTPHHWQRLLRVIHLHDTEFPEIRHLKVAALRYFWNDGGAQDLFSASGIPAATATIVEGLRDSVTEVVKSPASPPDSAVALLFNKGLLLLKRAEPDANIKVFVVLQPIGSLSDPALAESLAERMNEEVAPEFAQASLYSGDGNLASHMIRLNVGSYNRVLEVTRLIDTLIEKLPLRTMTLLVAEARPRESDNLNNARALSSSDHRTASVLGVEVEELAQISAADREQFEGLTTELAGLLRDSPEWETARSVLRACLRNDRRRVRQHLSFVLDFEFYFRDFVKATFVQRYGSEWIQIARETHPNPFRNVPDRDRDSADLWPLGVVHSLLREAVEDDSATRALVQASLGADWSQQVRNVLNLRNSFAHGRLTADVKRLDDLSSEWGVTLKSLLRALPLYTTLYSMVESETA